MITKNINKEEATPYKVYISCSARDLPKSEALAQSLAQVGASVCKPLPGDDLASSTTKALLDADAAVFLITYDTKEPPSFMLGEMTFALTVSQEKGTTIIPLIIGGDTTIPVTLASYLALRQIQFDPHLAALNIVTAIAASKERRRLQVAQDETARERVGQSAQTFVESAMKLLEERAKGSRQAATAWQVIGFVLLLFGCAYGLFSLTGKVTSLIPFNSIDSRVHIQFAAWNVGVAAVQAVFVVTVLVAASKYAFDLGRAFMHESIRNADRRHALYFGQLYLEVFANDVKFEEMKEAFQNWNIDSSSLFMSLRSKDYDPRILAYMAEATKSFGEKAKEKK